MWEAIFYCALPTEKKNRRNPDFFHMDEWMYFYRVLLKIRYKWNPSHYRQGDEVNYDMQLIIK